MGILNDLRSRVQDVRDGLQTGRIVRDVVINHGADIMELQRVQLLEGKASSGEDLRPYYSEDLKPGGYFHSVDSARRYSAWKQDGVSYPFAAKRNPDAPNLYINGKFHSELDVQFGPDSVAVVPLTAYARKIVDKYGSESFGLMAGKWAELFKERGAMDELLKSIKTLLFV